MVFEIRVSRQILRLNETIGRKSERIAIEEHFNFFAKYIQNDKVKEEGMENWLKKTGINAGFWWKARRMKASLKDKSQLGEG
jgi:hypothetical protein